MRSKKVPDVTDTLRNYRRHSEKLSRVISDRANELVKAAKSEDADALPLVPHRPQGNRLEREIETIGDRLRAAMIHAGTPPRLRPFASRYCSDMFKLFKQVAKEVGAGDDKKVEFASPNVHRFGSDPPWNADDVPIFGQTLTVVMPKVDQDNSRRTKSRGTPVIFLGVHSDDCL